MMSAIQGLYAAAVTPRRLGTQDINLGATWDLIDYLVAHGTQGIVLLGCTGEFLHFSTSERMRLMGVAVKRSRVPVIFNCSHSSFDGVVELSQSADAAGAAAVLVMPPYFFKYSQQQTLDFYRQFAETAQLECPLLLYNIPQFTGPIEFDTAAALFREGVAQGIKDSSGNLPFFQQLQELRRQQQFALMLGNDTLVVPARSGGCDGIISGVACALPELLIALDRAAVAGVTEVATRLEARLRQFIEQIDRLPTPVGVKEATAARGLKLGPHSLSCGGTFQKDIDAFREWFKDWLPAVLNECKHV
ncbi:MAG TPA: dihydrodipicolinate synthase family protein [Bryobacteraceae bacterium]|nr:dihydrodipicolinate synthase family protein [Bryobacteraceae bacterium]